MDTKTFKSSCIVTIGNTITRENNERMVENGSIGFSNVIALASFDQTNQRSKLNQDITIERRQQSILEVDL